jgi:hypothetical protein
VRGASEEDAAGMSALKHMYRTGTAHLYPISPVSRHGQPIIAASTQISHVRPGYPDIPEEVAEIVCCPISLVIFYHACMREVKVTWLRKQLA